MTLTHRQRSRKTGLSLVELLSGIAILAVLATLIIHVGSRALETARSTQCLNNVRQLGLAVLAYTQDSHGDFPYSYDSTAHESVMLWYRMITPYVGDSRPEELFFCPQENVRPIDNAVRTGRTSYTGNRRLFNDGRRDADGNMPDRTSIFSVSRPAETAMLYDGTVNEFGYTEPTSYAQVGQHIASIAYANDPLPNNEGNTGGDWRRASAVISWRHGLRTNVVFVDGHAASMALGELRNRNLQIHY